VTTPFTATEQEPGTTRTLLVEKDPGGSVVSQVRRTVLPGGLRVVTEVMPGVRSATVGAWVGIGSRDETPELHGASHFLEHVLFKGTPTRSAMDISVELDRVGGEFNAFTAKEYTCFHARVLDRDVPLAVDVLGDMVTSSLVTGEDVEAEREVILDEIAMHDDDPDDLVHNLHAEKAWGGTPLGRPIAGTVSSIEALTRDQIHGYYQARYRPENIVVAAAGNVDHDSVVRLVQAAFGRAGFLSDTFGRPLPPRRMDRHTRPQAGEITMDRPFEQVNLVLGVNGLVRTDDRRYALGVLNAVLGGGTSSRLFQEVRERRGLAYSVYSFASHYADTGMFGVGVGCLPTRLHEVLDVVRAEMALLDRHGITPEELERGKGQLRGGLILSMEDSGTRMSRIAKAELLYDELPGIDEVVGRVNAVSLEDVQILAKELFDGPETLAVVGPSAGKG
jgi:predicted Zn-dependent peptidase